MRSVKIDPITGEKHSAAWWQKWLFWQEAQAELDHDFNSYEIYDPLEPVCGEGRHPCERAVMQ